MVYKWSSLSPIQHLERSEVGTTFALSWILTWFSHDVDKVELMLRIFDVTLATHKFFPLYLSGECRSLMRPLSLND